MSEAIDKVTELAECDEYNVNSVSCEMIASSIGSILLKSESEHIAGLRARIGDSHKETY